MISRLLLIVRRRLLLLLLIPLIGAAVAFALTPRGAAADAATAFTSEALVTVDQAGASETEVQQDLVEATEGEVADEVADRLGDGVTPEVVRARTDASLDEESFVVSFLVTGPTVATAQETATAFGEVFVERGNSGATQQQDERLEAARAGRENALTFRDEFVDLNEAELASPAPAPETIELLAQLDAQLAQAEAELADVASIPELSRLYELISVSPGAPIASSRLDLLSSPAPRTALGFVLGALAALLVIIVAEKSNPRIDDPAAAEAIVGAPVLSLVPVLRRRQRKVLVRADPADFKGPFAEAFRTLRSTIDFRTAAEQSEKTPRIMVTSATPAEGKSTTAAFLALAYAQSEASPIVIGGDLRRPSIHRMFGVERTPGLSSRALSVEPPELADLIHTDPLTGIAVVPSGPSVDHVGPVVEDVTALGLTAQEAHRVVIVDTAPVRVANDAVDYLPAVDSVVIVVRIGRSTVRAVSQMMHTLRNNDAAVVGVVVLGSVAAADSSRYYYSYYAHDKAETLPFTKARPSATTDAEALPA